MHLLPSRAMRVVQEVVRSFRVSIDILVYLLLNMNEKFVLTLITQERHYSMHNLKYYNSFSANILKLLSANFKRNINFIQHCYYLICNIVFI